jgi:hypothetical protein
MSFIPSMRGAIIVDSSKRDLTQFPNPNTFQIFLPRTFGYVDFMTLTHFIPSAALPAIAGNTIFISVVELVPNNNFIPGNAAGIIPAFIIPALDVPYVSEEGVNDTSFFPRCERPKMNKLTFSLQDHTGALIAGFPDFVLRLYVEGAW